MELNQGLPVPAPVSESQPVRGPRGPRHIAAIAAGAYTDIVAIYGPAEALSGEQVNIQVVVSNLAAYSISIAVTGRQDGVDVAFTPDYGAVDPAGTYTFTASFTMPNKDITLDIWSWYWTGTEWYQDDHKAVSIKLKVLTPQFSGFGISDYSKA